MRKCYPLIMTISTSRWKGWFPSNQNWKFNRSSCSLTWPLSIRSTVYCLKPISRISFTAGCIPVPENNYLTTIGSYRNNKINSSKSYNKSPAIISSWSTKNINNCSKNSQNRHHKMMVKTIYQHRRKSHNHPNPISLPHLLFIRPHLSPQANPSTILVRGKWNPKMRHHSLLTVLRQRICSQIRGTLSWTNYCSKSLLQG